MAFYKYTENLISMDHEAFDLTYGPGKQVQHSGIFRCEGCGKEIAANAGDPLPPQNRHQHGLMQGPIKWRLMVWSQY